MVCWRVHRRTALRGTRLDRLRAASLTAIMWSFDRRPNPRQSVALWHLPGFLIPSQDVTDIPPRGTVLDFIVFALALVGLPLIIIWVVNNTRNSVFMATLVHASGNTFYSAALIRFSLSDRARKLLKSRDSCLRISTGAHCGYARPNRLS
jgi:hypothetical protein